MTAPVPVNIPLLDGDEKKLLIQCIESGWISSEGPFVREFEEKFAKRVHRTYAVAVTNGSAALEAAVASLRLKSGDEVILPTHTIISCAQAIFRAGAVPVPVDCDPLTWNITADHVAAAITRRTRAVLIVHTFGLPVDMGPILDLVKQYHLLLIEDAAEVHGQTWMDKPCGSFGDVSIFSFYPNKLITTGEGGMILTNNPEIAERCRLLRNLCFKEPRFVHDELGWNLRMTNMQAALGVAQLSRLDEFLIRKREMGRYYTEKLKSISGIQLPLERTAYAENMYWVYPIVLDITLPFDAKEAMRRFGEQAIGTRPFFWPIHEQPVFRELRMFSNTHAPTSENIARRGFYIPSGLGMRREQMDQVVDAAIEVLK